MTDLPSPNDLDLFVKIHDVLSQKPQFLHRVARELDRSPSTISACLTEMATYTGTPLLKPNVSPPELMPEATRLYERAKKVLALLRDLREPESAGRIVEVRVATTESLRARLFSGPVSAFMHWLRDQKDGRERHVRVRVDAFDHTELLQQVREGEYAFGVLWQLKEDWTDDDLCIEDILLPDDPRDAERTDLPRDYGVEVVALTPDPRYGTQLEEIKELFAKTEFDTRTDRRVLLSHLKEKLARARVVLINSETKDDVRIELDRVVSEETRVKVGTYEEVLSYVRMMICDIGWGPAWFRHRHHVEARTILDEEKHPYRRRIKICRPKSPKDGGPARLDPDAKAFYCLFRAFLSDPAIYHRLFSNSEKTWTHHRDHMITPAEVVNWLNYPNTEPGYKFKHGEPNGGRPTREYIQTLIDMRL